MISKVHLYILILLLFTACKDPTRPEDRLSVWENLNFPVTNAFDVSISGDHVYVATGSKGLYSLKINETGSDWNYLGFDISDSTDYIHTGTTIVDTYENEVIVNASYSFDREDNSKTCGIWKSSDKGTSWECFDQGMQLNVQKSFRPRDIVRSPDNPDFFIAADGTIFLRNEEVQNWTPVHPQRQDPNYWSTTNGAVLSWNAHDENHIWFMGDSHYLFHYLGRSIDAGKTWTFNLDYTPHHKVDYMGSIVFDAVDPYVVYGTRGGIVMSLNKGDDWMEDDSATVVIEYDSFPDSLPPPNIIAHPTLSGILFGSRHKLETPRRDYLTKLYGILIKEKKVVEIEVPDELESIYSLTYDEKRDDLYVYGTGGVFRLINPMQKLEE